MRGIAVEAVCSGERSKSDLYIAIRFFLLIRRRELSNSISLQKCFHQIKIPFRLNNEAHMSARNRADLCIQFPEQICEPFLIFFFENVIFLEKDQYPPPADIQNHLLGKAGNPSAYALSAKTAGNSAIAVSLRGAQSAFSHTPQPRCTSG